MIVLTPIEQIKERLDIVDVVQGYIRLNKAGVNYKACCPFHNEKTPSFTVSPEKQIWHCFGCNLGGDIFSFVMQIEGIEFRDALRILADKAGIKLQKQDPKLISERTKIEKALQEANFYFQNQLINSAEGKMALEYLLKERGLTKQSVNNFSVGYAPNSWQALSDYLVLQGIAKGDIVKSGLAFEKDGKPGTLIDRFRGRIMFPISTGQGRIAGFSGRIFPPAYKGQDTSSVGKYINTPQTPLFNKSILLYGLDKAKADIRRKNVCIIVEGQMDVVMSHQAGIINTVASSGTALTLEQLQIIRRLADNLILAFDSDEAGIQAAQKGIDLALKLGYNIKVAKEMKGKDAAEIIKENPENWGISISRAVNIVDFYFEIAFKNFDPDSSESKKKAAAKILPIAAKLPNEIERAHYIRKIAEKLNVSESVLERAIYLSRQNGQKYQKPEDQARQADFIKKQRTRRQLLEEKILACLLSDKLKDLNFLNKEGISPGIFKNQHLREIAEIFWEKLENGDKNPHKIENLIKKDETKRVLNYLLILGEDNLNADDFLNFKNDIKQLRELSIREALRSLSDDIKKAEAKKDKETLKVLVEEFQKFSKKLESRNT